MRQPYRLPQLSRSKEWPRASPSMPYREKTPPLQPVPPKRYSPGGPRSAPYPPTTTAKGSGPPSIQRSRSQNGLFGNSAPPTPTTPRHTQSLPRASSSVAEPLTRRPRVVGTRPLSPAPLCQVPARRWSISPAFLFPWEFQRARLVRLGSRANSLAPLSPRPASPASRVVPKPLRSPSQPSPPALSWLSRPGTALADPRDWPSPALVRACARSHFDNRSRTVQSMIEVTLLCDQCHFSRPRIGPRALKRLSGEVSLSQFRRLELLWHFLPATAGGS